MLTTPTMNYKTHLNANAPLFTPLEAGWREKIQAQAECYLKRSQTPPPSTQLKRANSQERDLKIAEALKWLSDHPPTRT
ncbi:hypothetical protein OIV83_003686 [Microbotryomycetes sp. JL201]|nr:hypothetical protein OIV83_003686 [Microbotryomycetes sp. JL201]